MSVLLFPPGLMASVRPIRHQLGHPHPKSRSKPLNRVQANVGPPAFDVAHVGPIHLGEMGKILLRPFVTLSVGFDPLAEDLSGRTGSIPMTCN